MLDDLDRKIINQLVYTTKKNIEIYKDLGIPKGTFYRRTAKPEFQAELKRQINESLAIEAAQAKQVLTNLLDSDSEMIQLRAAIEILNKAGYKESQKTEISTDDSIKINITGGSD